MTADVLSRVDTGELDERRRALETVLRGLADCAGAAVRAAPSVGAAAPERVGELELLGRRLTGLEGEAALLREALGEAVSAYERAEEALEEQLPVIPARVAPLVAAVAFGLRASESFARRVPGAREDAALLVRATAEAAFGSVGAAARVLAGDDGARDELSAEKADLVRALLGDPLLVEGLRAVISTIGLGTEVGVLLLPPPVTAALGGRSAGETVGGGVSSAASVLVVLATVFGVVPPPGERRLRVQTVEPPPIRLGSAAEAPSSWGELAARIPPSDPDGPQVVIEEFGGEWLVTVSGTTDWSLDPEQAFGAASNLKAMSGGGAASVAGTLAAMEAAGIPEGAPVTIAAHSQGGLVALRVAQSGRYDVHDVIAFGSPIRGLDLPSGTRSVSIEHSDDLVPALSGFGRTAGQEQGVIVVERDSPASTPQEGPVPAHALESYVATAQTLDADPRLAASGAALFGLWTAAPGSRVGARLTTVPVSPRGAPGTAGRAAR
ncbi:MULTISPECIES: hypothetical protein [unclassified Rathayibacter]|uniref:hypothetical protein n=1 Tax=unclassified Rathayibacter TaxID=2609250 RepID=UPI0006F257F2|nr:MULTISPECIES: hypothetical protein [unclassified Rathayibacter]KQQ05705.1 hypothetical protein ASF42_03835 [Rathayibacter sp. Leaf294]KQS13563.1 hypothetical protein ASG06_03845 [Rathayibacter sp. Leaf185]